MAYRETIGEICLCLWRVLIGIVRGIFHSLSPPRRKSVTGWNILITGGANGLGKLLAVQFAKLGANIILWDIDEDGLDKIRSELEFLSATVHTYKCNLSERDEIVSAASQVKRDVGDVDMVVNNAGTVVAKTLAQHRPEDVVRTFNVNVLSQFWTLECFLPRMMERNHGHIVSISSVAAIFGNNRMGSYCATKFALNGLMESLRCDLSYGGYTNIHTTTICPYIMNTDLFKGCTIKYPSLFPCLRPDYVARRTLQAILTNQTIVCIPRTFYVLSIIKAILPSESMTAIHECFGADRMMDGFVGRNEQTACTQVRPIAAADTTGDSSVTRTTNGVYQNGSVDNHRLN